MKLALPLLLPAIAAARRKNEPIDAVKFADCLGCDFLYPATLTYTRFSLKACVLRAPTQSIPPGTGHDSCMGVTQDCGSQRE